jgi:glyoxylase-like metal-dependent hydrolase (beta-lactamase superfamily II)
MSSARAVAPRITSHPDGITAVDTEYIRPGLAAAHILQQGGRAAVIDVGTNSAVPLVLAALDELGIRREAVDLVLLTHVHLDHAGGAGALMQALPDARAVVHPRGAPHLIDPTRLIQASIAVYGEARYRALYGELVPIPRERVITMHDGQRLSLSGRALQLIDTPGHALHHYCVIDPEYANAFTGDTFGLSYRELDTAAGAFILPTTTPTQFDPEQLVRSIDRVLSYGPRAVYLMHYSRVTGVPQLGESLKAQVRALAELARRHALTADRATALTSEMRALWLGLARRHGITLSEERLDEILGKDLELNVQGLIAWLDRRAAAARA